MIKDVKANLFQSQLRARGDVAITIQKLLARCAWWSKEVRILIRKDAADHRRTFIPRHLNSLGVMAKVIEVQTKLPVLFGANDLAKLVDESRPAVRREAHHLAFVAVMRKAEKLCCRRVDDAGRVWILNLAKDVDRVSLTQRPHRRDEIAEAVDR